MFATIEQKLKIPRFFSVSLSPSLSLFPVLCNIPDWGCISSLGPRMRRHIEQDPRSFICIQAKPSLSHSRYWEQEFKFLYIFTCIGKKVSKTYTKMLNVLIKSMYTSITFTLFVLYCLNFLMQMYYFIIFSSL